MEEKWLFADELLVKLSFVTHVIIRHHIDAHDVIDSHDVVVYFTDGNTFLCGRYKKLIDAKKHLSKIEKAIQSLCES